MRRGLGEPAAARAFLAADEPTRWTRSAGCATAPARILGHVARRLADHRPRRLRRRRHLLDRGADPRAAHARRRRRLVPAEPRSTTATASRAATVERLAARGTDLLVTVDCAITAVEEVARARAAGIDVVVTDHHAPRADGALPDAPIVHPRHRRLPVPGPVRRRRRATSSPSALLDGARRGPGGWPTRTSTSSRSPRSPTSSRCWARTAGSCAPGLRALAVDAQARAARADGRRARRPERRSTRARSASGSARGSTPPAASTAPTPGSSCCSPRTASARARSPSSSTRSTPSAATSRRGSASRPRRRSPSRAPGAPAYVLAAEGWHPGVIGIVAARIAERHHRPTRADRARRRGGHGLRALDPRLRPARRPRAPAPTTCCATAATAPPPA